jgi:hypothetical protein
MSDFASVLISSAVVVLWISFIAPLLCGLFGAPLPFSFRQRRAAIRKWSFRRYLWLWGVLTFGMAMFLGMGLNQYFEWQHWNYPWPKPSITVRMLLLGTEWLAFGAVWGWLTWDGEKHQESLR